MNPEVRRAAMQTATRKGEKPKMILIMPWLRSSLYQMVATLREYPVQVMHTPMMV
jgi:hypothetical protein